MHVEIEDLSPVEKKLNVEVPWEQVRAKLDAAYRELSRGAKLKGFRPGKVPRSVLEQMFGKQVQLDVARDLVRESFLAAAGQHKLEPVAAPVIEEGVIHSGESFRYSARIEIRQPIEVKDWEGLTAGRPKIELSEQEVEAALERRRLLLTEYRPVEGRAVTTAQDVVIVSVKGQVGELPLEKPELLVDLGPNEREPLPGLAAALTDIAIDTAEHEIVLEIPADHPQKEIAGQTAKLKIMVRDVREKVVPALDDEFAKDTGDADTLAELREKMRERLLREKEQQVDLQVREQLARELVRRNPVQLAQALIERGIDMQLKRAKVTLRAQGIDLDQYGVDMQTLRERLRESAAEEVRTQLLLESLADAHNLEVADAALDQRIAQLAALRDKPAARLKAEMDRDNTLETLRYQMRQEKALDLVVSRATITDTLVSKEM